jgi:hypothetical protein
MVCRRPSGEHMVEEPKAGSACIWAVGGVEDVLVCPAIVFAIRALVECNGSYVQPLSLGAVLLWRWASISHRSAGASLV